MRGVFSQVYRILSGKSKIRETESLFDKIEFFFIVLRDIFPLFLSK